MPSEYANVPRQGDRMRAHSVLFQRNNAAAAGYAVVSGMDPVRSSATAVLVAAGYYRSPSGVGIAFTQASITGIPAAASGKHRYDLIVFDCTDSTLKRVAGTEGVPTLSTDFLENLAPLPPELPNLKCILITIICVDENGVQSTNHGHYCTAGVADFRRVVPVGHAQNTDTYLNYGGASQVAAADAASAVALKHSHSNKTGLDKLTSYRLEFCLYGTPAVLTASQTYPGIEVPIAGTITEVRVMSNDNTSGSISVALKKGTYANAPATLSTILTAAISSFTKSEVTGQSIAVAAGDWIIPYINSVTSLKNVTVSLKVEI